MILAPLAGITDYPFRTLCYDCGCQLAYSEMVSSEGLIRGAEKTFRYLYQKENAPAKNTLIAFQIFGAKPEVMAEAAEIVEQKDADIIDINMGCPVKKVIKSNAGSALLKDPVLIKKIVTAVRKKINTPFTVKIRSGWDNTDHVETISQILEDCGVDAVILHPRTQKQGFGGKADWRLIEKVKNKLKIPVIGNGDVYSFADYQRMIHETGCDGVMIGRGVMGNPWIFNSYYDNDFKPTLDDLEQGIKKHYLLTVDFYGEKEAVKIMRKHLSWYTKGLPESSALRNDNNKLTLLNEVMSRLDQYFAYLRANPTASAIGQEKINI